MISSKMFTWITLNSSNNGIADEYSSLLKLSYS